MRSISPLRWVTSMEYTTTTHAAPMREILTATTPAVVQLATGAPWKAQQSCAHNNRWDIYSQRMLCKLYISYPYRAR